MKQSSEKKDPKYIPSPTRRKFLKQTSLVTALTVVTPILSKVSAETIEEETSRLFEQRTMTIEVNGKPYSLSVEPRATLLDVLRENLKLTGTKKGCDFGQCGACTVHINGERKLSCLSLAVMQDGKKITTIEGLAKGDDLHPMQAAFIKHDGFQCGYCTPGQIMSAIACVNEGRTGTREECREYMSGNICRCGAYPNIVDAIMEVSKTG